MQLKKIQTTHEELILEIAGHEIPANALKGLLMCPMIMALVGLAYVMGMQMQLETMKWFAFYSDKGLCGVMQVKDSFVLRCGEIQDTNLTKQPIMFPIGNATNFTN